MEEQKRVEERGKKRGKSGHTERERPYAHHFPSSEKAEVERLTLPSVERRFGLKKSSPPASPVPGVTVS
jgi:hypothetical protein